MTNIISRPGWIGLHTTDQAPGAYPNGTRIIKSRMGEGDSHKVGDKGTVIGSMYAAEVPSSPQETYFYFVEWDDVPTWVKERSAHIAVGVVGSKIEMEL